MATTHLGARLLQASALAVAVTTGCWSDSSAVPPAEPPAANVETLPELPDDLVARNATLVSPPATNDGCESAVTDLATRARDNDPHMLPELIAYLRNTSATGATTGCLRRAQALYCDETLRIASQARRVIAVAEVRRRCASYLAHSTDAVVMQFAAIALWPHENVGPDAYLGIAEIASYALDRPDAAVAFELAANAFARAGGCPFISIARLDALLERARVSTEAHAVRGISALSHLRVRCAAHP